MTGSVALIDLGTVIKHRQRMPTNIRGYFHRALTIEKYDIPHGISRLLKDFSSGLRI